MRFDRVLGVLTVIWFIGCGVNTGPGSPVDALRFANNRVAELSDQRAKRITKQDDVGKWHSEVREVRKPRPGFVEETGIGTRPVEAIVEYEFRVIKSGPFETREKAESAEPRSDRIDWQQQTENFIFEDGRWVLKE